MGSLCPVLTTHSRLRLSVMASGRKYIYRTLKLKSFLTFSFSHPSWEVNVEDRKRSSKVLLPDNLDRLKEINTYISGVLKRPVYADIPDKQFKAYFQKQLVEHIQGKDINKVIISYTGL